MMSNKNLSINHLKEGDKGVIATFQDEKIASKMIAMGVLPGSTIEIIRKAPFGGGFYVKVDGHGLAIRKNEAESIVFEK